MIREETHELIQLAADRVASDSQKAELDRLVAQSPEVRAEVEALSSVVRQLEDAAAVDAPGDLREEILRELREKRGDARTSVVVGRFGPRARLVLVGGWVAAAAILATVILVPAFRTSVDSATPSAVSGAMAGRPSWTAVSASDGQLQVTARRTADEVNVQVSGASGHVRVAWDAGALTMFGGSGASSETSIVCAEGKCPILTARLHRATVLQITSEGSHAPLELKIPGL